MLVLSIRLYSYMLLYIIIQHNMYMYVFAVKDKVCQIYWYQKEGIERKER